MLSCYTRRKRLEMLKGPTGKIAFHYLTYKRIEELGIAQNIVISLVKKVVSEASLKPPPVVEIVSEAAQESESPKTGTKTEKETNVRGNVNKATNSRTGMRPVRPKNGKPSTRRPESNISTDVSGSLISSVIPQQSPVSPITPRKSITENAAKYKSQ
jgi:hypothetical protein